MLIRELILNRRGAGSLSVVCLGVAKVARGLSANGPGLSDRLRSHKNRICRLRQSDLGLNGNSGLMIRVADD